MKLPFFRRKENTEPKPKRTRRVETTPDEDRIKREQEYRKRIRNQRGRRSYGSK